MISFILAAPTGFLGLQAWANSLPGPAPLFIAQLGTPTEVELYSWLKVLVALLAIAALVKALFPTRRPPIEAEYATKAEVRVMINEVIQDIKDDRIKIENRLVAVEGNIRDELGGIRKDASARASGLHKRIDDVAEAVRGVSEVLNLIKGNITMKFNGGPN